MSGECGAEADYSRGRRARSHCCIKFRGVCVIRAVAVGEMIDNAQVRGRGDVVRFVYHQQLEAVGIELLQALAILARERLVGAHGDVCFPRSFVRCSLFNFDRLLL